MLVNILNAYGKDDMRLGMAMLFLYLICILLALICHEVAHGLVASWLGDPTAKQLGRLTLNPMAHLDPVGFLMMLVVGFGWAKPVPVNPRRLRKPRRDMALVSFAGPATNLLLALFAGLLLRLLMSFGIFPFLLPGAGLRVNAPNVISIMLEIFMLLNVGLALFNLIPLPPLDGSNILVSFLPPNTAARYLQVRRYTQYIFLGLIAISWFSNTLYDTIWYPFNWLRGTIVSGILSLGDLLFGWI